ncbi:aldehyde-activating protein [Rhizobium rhizosphaerae]|uniref:Aldehyde-activating protein n=1 Tax=Xaviernesmea rhizosphaerae TaxID=1672749 RepID=A0ABX3P7S7_9HYPH|nr:GFA family protein [Xaviernesmea rhizosphaerae]OQP84078.1 aldehyde-activating protein [Xaviernesmea rhizosphaerae]
MRIDGGCHCGAIAYEAEVDPEAVGLCHCTDCQALTGSAFRVTVTARAQDFRITRGEPTIYRKQGDNGRPRLQAFCRQCGSPLYTTGVDEDAEAVGIRWGGIAQRRSLAPNHQIWCNSAADWLDSIGRLPARPRD